MELAEIRRLENTFKIEIGERAYAAYYLETYILDTTYIITVPESGVVN